MRNMRKLSAIVLCLMLVTTSFATVSAEESEFSGIVSKKVNVLENGDVEVLIDLAGNPGITALSLSVKYDSSALTFKENGFVDTGLLKSRLDTKFKGSNVNRKIDVGILNNKDRIATYGYYQEYGSRHMIGKKWMKKSWQKSIKEASNKIGEGVVNEILK